MKEVEWFSDDWDKLPISERLNLLRKSYGTTPQSPCFGTLEDMAFVELIKDSTILETQFKQAKELWENACTHAGIAEARVSAVKELMIEWMGSVEYSDIERARRLRVALATMPQDPCKTQSTFISKEQGEKQ